MSSAPPPDLESMSEGMSNGRSLRQSCRPLPSRMESLISSMGWDSQRTESVSLPPEGVEAPLEVIGRGLMCRRLDLSHHGFALLLGHFPASLRRLMVGIWPHYRRAPHGGQCAL